MGKYALLIGISEYPDGLAPLPAATQDVAAMERVLKNSDLGNFDNVECLLNPRQSDMAQRIERWFGERQEDDLALLFFSGHGVKDERRKLYFAASNTEKVQGKLIRSTALAASSVHDFIRFGKCRQQVVILDCCFSGAFGDVLLAKDDGEIELEEQLGAEGRVVLASTSSVDYSFEEKGSGLSVYTRYLVEGIEKGAADIGGDGWISVDELHQFASGKVRETAPAMSPKIIMLKDEGYRIVLARSPQDKPEVKYRRAVESCASEGRFSKPAKRLLASLRKEYGLSAQIVEAIEAEVLQPFREYQRKLEEYRKAVMEAIEEEPLLSQSTVTDLKKYQHYLGLRDEDVQTIEASLPGHIPSLFQKTVEHPKASGSFSSQEFLRSTPQRLSAESTLKKNQKQEKIGTYVKSVVIDQSAKREDNLNEKVTANAGLKDGSRGLIDSTQIVEEIDFSSWKIHPKKYLPISVGVSFLFMPVSFIAVVAAYRSKQMMESYHAGDYRKVVSTAKKIRTLWWITLVLTILTVTILITASILSSGY